jgi:hypothetical protein
MLDDAIERFQDVLQNIEYAILLVYENDASLLDLDVIDALDALVRTYAAEERARIPPKLPLSARARAAFEAAKQVCEWRLGRALVDELEPDTLIPTDQRIGIADILICLKRIRKSVHIWNEEGGRQGYLNYISSFLQGTEQSSPTHRRT